MRAFPKGKPDTIIWVTFGGKTFRCSRRTAAHLLWTQAQLDKKHPGCRLVVIQGCYNTGVTASQGTHDFDRALDVSIVGMDWWDAQRFLRSCGWAAWVREPPAFTWHIHMISLGGTPTKVGIYIDGGLSTMGRVVTSSQIDDYYRHTLGLKDQHNTDLDKSWFPGDDGPPPWPIGTPEQWRTDIDATLFDFALWERELEDNMPYLDWPENDRKALAKDIADEILGRDLDRDPKKKLPVAQALRQAARAPEVARQVGQEVTAAITGSQ